MALRFIEYPGDISTGNIEGSNELNEVEYEIGGGGGLSGADVQDHVQRVGLSPRCRFSQLLSFSLSRTRPFPRKRGTTISYSPPQEFNDLQAITGTFFHSVPTRCLRAPLTLAPSISWPFAQ